MIFNVPARIPGISLSERRASGLHAYAMCSANHGREHDELGADTLFTNRRLRVRQPPRLKRSPTTDPSSHKNDPSSSPAQRPYLSYSPPGPITGHILYRALISPSHPTICRSSLDSLHIIFKATYRRLNRYSYPAPCSTTSVQRILSPSPASPAVTAVIFKMKARGRTQSGDHVIFKATYSGVPVYEFMCKGYLPLPQLPGNSPVGADRSGALSGD